MGSLLDLAIGNLTSPMIMFFALGVAAALARSDLNIPEAVAKGLSIYLMMAIGFKGGASVAAHGVDLKLILSLLAGTVLSAAMPIIAFRLLMTTTALPRVDAAAVAAHFGSISIVTFLAMTQALANAGIDHEGYMVAVAATMETPAIIAALWLAYSGGRAQSGQDSTGKEGGLDASSLREIFLNGSIVMLVGAFVIGIISGAEGLATLSAFIVAPFKGVLCLFLLDMGLLAGRGLREGRKDLTWPLIGFGIYMPLIGAVLGAGCGALIGLSTGGTALFAVLAASASYIAVPAAMRLALPDARPAIYLPLSLGVTFPFNLTVGIPIYVALALAVT